MLSKRTSWQDKHGVVAYMPKAFKHCGPDPKPLTQNEAVAIATVCRMLLPNPVIVQIGAYIGASTIAMLETRSDAYIFSIDMKPCREEKINLIEAGLNYQRVVRVLGDSSQIDWPFQIDMLYIDGNHYYEAVKADCEAWLERTGKLYEGGYIVFHDYIPTDAPPKNQVCEVVNELFEDVEPFIQVERIIGFEL